MYLAHICLLMFACTMALGANTDAPRITCRRTLTQARKLYCIDSTQNIRRRKEVPASEFDNYVQQSKPVPVANYRSSVTRSPEYEADLLAERAESDVPDYVEKCCQKPCYVTELLTDC